jgi:hypothetical protein
LIAISSVQLEMLRGESFDQIPALGVQRTVVDQDLGHRSALGARPNMKRRDQGRLVDQTCLKGQEPAEHVTRGLESLCHVGTSNKGGPRLLSTVMSGVCNPVT